MTSRIPCVGGLAVAVIVLAGSVQGCHRDELPPRLEINSEALWHGQMLAAGHFGVTCEQCASRRDGPGVVAERVPPQDVDLQGLAQTIMDKLHREGTVLGEPWHLKQLIRLGRHAGPVLIGMLNNARRTPVTYLEQLDFMGHKVCPGPEPVRRATVGDLADYALRAIYKVDVGWRSYHTEHRRGEALARWRDVVRRDAGQTPRP
jgi:hypothetical protein